MRSFGILLFINILCFQYPASSETVSNIIAHCRDQENRISNDPKGIYGDKSYGQTFIPNSEELSFLRIKGTKKTGKLKAKNTPSLELRLWKCARDYKTSKNVLPLATIEGKTPLEFGGSIYFKANAKVSPKQPHYWEITAPSDPETNWIIWRQYGSDAYKNGAFAVNGNRRGLCDFDFSTYNPVELEPQSELKCFPEIIEIYFNEEMDTDKTIFYLTESGKAPENPKIFWDGKNKATLILKTSKGKRFALEVNAVSASGKSEKITIPFFVSPSKEKIRKEIFQKSKTSKSLSSIKNSDVQKKLRGIIRACLKNIKTNDDSCEFSINAHIEPVSGMQTSFKQITPETLDEFASHNINAVSVSLPNFLEKPELLEEVKKKAELIHNKGLLLFWLISLSPAGYDNKLLGNKNDARKIAWNGKRLKKYCLNNPSANKAIISNLKKYLKTLNDNHIFLDEMMFNEPLRKWGEFCYCPECRKRFKKEYGTPMPLPINLPASEIMIPVNWPSGIPKEKYIKQGDLKKWKNMSEFYCKPMTERIFNILESFRESFPNLSCQFTTLTDIAPFYGINYSKIINFKNFDGVQPAIYWRLGDASPKKVGSPNTANKFVKAARERNISCYYWLQGYDAGDNSAPLRPGDIKQALNEAFAKGVDGIIIWSYLNPILGPWDKPYHWPEYFDEFKDAIEAHIKQHEISGKFSIKKGEKNKFSITKDGLVFNLETSLEENGNLSLDLRSKGYRVYKNKINIYERNGE